MKMVSLVAAGLAALQLSACVSATLQNVKPIPQSQISAVMEEAKRQIGVYTAYQRSKYGYPRIIAASRTKHCGNGMIGFDIKSATLKVATTASGSAGIQIGLNTLPVGPGATIGGKVNASSSSKDTQTLVLPVNVRRASPPVEFDPDQLETAPLAVAMINLWGAALDVGDAPTDVCFQLQSNAQGGGNSYTLALNWIETAGGQISLGLAPLVFTPSGEVGSETGNTITVNFEPHDFSRPPPPPPLPCPPRSTAPECVNILRQQGITG